MKRFIIILSVFGLTACSAGILRGLSSYNDGDRFFYFPDDNGKLQLVDTQEHVDEDFLQDYAKNPANNGYWLYTRANYATPQILQLGNNESVITSNFDGSKITVFLAHGWNGHGGNLMNQLLVAAFLEDDDINVIVLDWKELANKNYITAKIGVADVGKGLGQFVNWLTNFGATYETTHLVGFSLGAHLVGNAGRVTGSKVKRITALDPAGPLWSIDPNRIVKTDGEYVEVIHTEITLHGFTGVCGHADFYPNGGSNMPGCFSTPCSHSLVYEYMAATVKYNHLWAKECRSLWEAFTDSCSGDVNPMGNSDLYKSRSGIFRVNTASQYPF